MEQAYAPNSTCNADLHSRADNECLISSLWQPTKFFNGKGVTEPLVVFPFQKKKKEKSSPSVCISLPLGFPTNSLQRGSTSSFSFVTRSFNHRLADNCRTHKVTGFLLTLTAASASTCRSNLVGFDRATYFGRPKNNCNSLCFSSLTGLYIFLMFSR